MFVFSCWKTGMYNTMQQCAIVLSRGGPSRCGNGQKGDGHATNFHHSLNLGLHSLLSY